MDRQQDIVTRIKNIKRELVGFKSSQPITGDSWVLYRYDVNITAIGTNSYIYMIFTQDDTTYPAVVRPLIEPVFDRTPVGFIPQNGVHVFLVGNYTQTVKLTANVSGTITTSDTPPFPY